MLALQLSLQPNIDEWDRTLTATQQQVKIALTRALNKTARWMRTHIARETAAVLKLRLKDVNPRLSLVKAGRNNPAAGVGLKGSATIVKSIQLGSARQTSSGVRVGRYNFSHAFIASMRTGHQGIFRRQGKARLPIREVQLNLSGRMQDVMQILAQGKALAEFEKVFEREIKYLMK